MADGKSIKKDREMFVVKSNDLIRARYNLTTQQQKIILYAISKIKPNDNPGKWYEVSIDGICDACGLDIDAGGVYYQRIKKDLRELTTRLWVTLPDKREITVAWISDAQIIPLSGKVYIKFHEALEEHLFWLQSCYTQYKLQEVLSFHNKYAIRIYEILRSYISREDLENGKEREKSFSIEELRELLKIETYPKWAELDRNVIRKAVDEINKYSDIMRVSYDPLKRGRKVTMINFIVTSPKAMEAYVSRQAARKRIDGSRQNIKSEEVIQKIKNWRKQNPKGKRTDCIKETGITKYAAYRYWSEADIEIKEEKINKIKGKMEERDKKIKTIQNLKENLKDKKEKLDKMLMEEAPRIAEQLVEKINIAEGEEKKAVEDELNDFINKLNQIAEYVKAAEDVEALRELINRE